jgi:EAL domain-containing protein (putative c-di-GMP-specific phosphodiesterase class I)
MLGNARRSGASLVQGYHFARPMPLSALDAWVEGFSLARH